MLTKTAQKELSGPLLKLGAVHRTWKERWFVLDGTRLSYFKSKDAQKAIQIIPVQDSHAQISSEKFSHEHCFEVITPTRTFFLAASSHAMTMQWISTLKNCSKLSSESRLIQETDDMICELECLSSSQQAPDSSADDDNNGNAVRFYASIQIQPRSHRQHTHSSSLEEEEEEELTDNNTSSETNNESPDAAIEAALLQSSPSSLLMDSVLLATDDSNNNDKTTRSDNPTETE